MDGFVYVNHGRVIVDCPAECGSAYKIVPGQTQQLCNAAGGCTALFSLVIPVNLADLVTELDKRPKPQTRNWFPEGHSLALRANLPQGQTVEDLRAEFELMMGAAE